MHWNTLRDASFRIAHGVARATINKSSDDPKMQEMSADFMNNDSREKVERVQNYGFSSVPLPRDEKKQQSGGSSGSAEGGEQQKGPAAEALVMFMGGQRNHPVIIGVDDRRHRPRDLKPGENIQYDDQGQAMYLKRDGSYVVSPKKISLRHATKEKQGAGKEGAGYKHEGESGKVSAEIVIEDGNIKFLIGGVVMGEVSSEGFVIGGAMSDAKKRQVFRKDDIDDAGNKPELHAKKGWAV